MDYRTMSDKDLQIALETIQEEQRLRKESNKNKAWNEVREALQKYFEVADAIEVIDRCGKSLFVNKNYDMLDVGIISYDF